MHWSHLWLATLAVTCPFALADSVDDAINLYPSCAISCLAELVPSSGCALTDTACLCTNTPLNANLENCIKTGCKVPDQLRSKNASISLCDPSPPRDKTTSVMLGGLLPGAIALIVFLARLASLLPTAARIASWDDWTLCVMVLFTIPPTVFSVTLAHHGLGKDIWTLEPSDITAILRYYYLGEIFYIAALTMFKVSMLCFILRIFMTTKPLRIGTYIGLGITITYGVSFLFATIFQCSPVDMAWYQWDGEHEGTCENIKLQSWLCAALNIVIDIYILVLPLREVSKLKMNTMKKLMLMFMFSLGIFVTLTSVLRLRTLVTFANTQNPTYDYVEAATWSTVELHVGIICACLPSLRSLFIVLGAKILASSKDTSGIDTGFGSSGWRTPSRLQKISLTPRLYSESGDFINLVDVDAKHDDTPDSKASSDAGLATKREINATKHYV